MPPGIAAPRMEERRPERRPLTLPRGEARLPDPLALHCRRLSAAYGDLLALDRVDLDVAAGEFVAVTGPSGCGKSTLLRILAGLQPPRTGTVSLGPTPAGPACPGLAALMPQRDALLPWRTLRDNVALGPSLAGAPWPDAQRLAAAALAAVGLDGFAAAHPGALSGGMRQRAALLRSALAGKGALLLDEPLGALDALTRAELQRWLEDLWLTGGRRKPTVVLVTHDVAEAVQLADRVVVMTPRPGRIAAIRDVAAPRPRPAAFRASPEGAALVGTLLRDLAAASEASPGGN